jgi:hypothetical protein
VKAHLITQAKVTALLVGTVLLLIVCSAFVNTLRAERKARQLLNDCRSLEVGVSTEAEVQRLVREYGGEAGGLETNVCEPGRNTNHSVAVTSDSANWIGKHLPFLHPFGNRWWVAEAFFAFDNGHLCFVSYNLRTYLTPRGRYDLWVSATAQGSPSPEIDAYGLSVGPKRNLEYFQAQVWANATSLQRQRAFDFDLSCLTRFEGCRAGCEVMPSAWLNYQRTARQRGWPLPHVELEDPRCEKLSE